MKKDKNIGFDNNKGATHLYVRSGFFSKLRQVLTSRTDGAMKKQNKAKELIIKTLDKLPDDLKSNDFVKQSIKNITDTLKNNELKDFTAGMIRKDLDVINKVVQLQNEIANPLYESKPVNPLYRGNSKEPDPAKRVTSDAVTAATPKVEKNVPTDGTKEPFVLKLKNEEISGGNVTEPVFNEFFDYFNFDSNDDRAKKAVLALTKEVLNKGNEEIVDSSVPAVDVNQVVNTSSKVVDKDASVANIPARKNGVLPLEDDEISDGDDALSEVGSGSDSDDEDGAVSSSESELPANETSSDPVVNGKPAEETTSSLAESAPIINTTPAPIGKAIEQGADTAEAATENTPRPAPSASSSTAETKSNETANRYLESLKSKWSAAENGYFEVSKPFYITGQIPTLKMLAQAYLFPAGKEIEFSGEKVGASKSLDGASSLNEGQVVHGVRTLRNDVDLSDSTRDERPYLKLEVKASGTSFQASKSMAKNPAMGRLSDSYKQELIDIYKNGVKKISADYKQKNQDEDLESLVIVPINSTAGLLMDVEIIALISAVIDIQAAYPNLKIAISANKKSHADEIEVAYDDKVSQP
jgi:hypothetical protein